MVYLLNDHNGHYNNSRQSTKTLTSLGRHFVDTNYKTYTSRSKDRVIFRLVNCSKYLLTENHLSKFFEKLSYIPRHSIYPSIFREKRVFYTRLRLSLLNPLYYDPDTEIFCLIKKKTKVISISNYLCFDNLISLLLLKNLNRGCFYTDLYEFQNFATLPAQMVNL